jgi:hypothetical protein
LTKNYHLPSRTVLASTVLSPPPVPAPEFELALRCGWWKHNADAIASGQDAVGERAPGAERPLARVDPGDALDPVRPPAIVAPEL